MWSCRWHHPSTWPLQVYHDSPLPSGDTQLLGTLTETGVEVKVHEVGGPPWPRGQVGTSGLADSDLCDCGLQAALAPALLSSFIHLKEEDIVMTAEVPHPLSASHPPGDRLPLQAAHHQRAEVGPHRLDAHHRGGEWEEELQAIAMMESSNCPNTPGKKLLLFY